MKRSEIILAGVADAVPVACGMLAVTCAVMTAYQIGFSLVPLILFCAFSALLLSFWMNVPRYGFGFGALFLTCVILLCTFRMRQIGEGAVTFVHRMLNTMPKTLSELFDMDSLAYAAAQVEDPEGTVTLFLMLLAGANGVILAFSLVGTAIALEIQDSIHKLGRRILGQIMQQTLNGNSCLKAMLHHGMPVLCDRNKMIVYINRIEKNQIIEHLRPP